MAMEKAKTIAALRRQLKSVTNETAKKALTKKIERLKTELEAEKTPTKQLAMQLSKARAEINAMSKSDFNAMIKKLAMKPEYSFLKGMTKQEIKDDLDREAKPVGWRFRGRDNFKKPTKADIKQGKNVYYENRPNRSDVIYPAKLMQGGKLVPKELSTAWEEKTEDINRLNSIIERIRVKEGSTPNVKRMQKQLMRLKNERKEIFNSISKFAKGGKIQVGTFVRYKKDDDFTGGKVITINNDQAEIRNWDGSTIKLPVKDLEYVESWNRKMAKGGGVVDKEILEGAVDFLIANGYANIIEDDKGNFVVSDLDDMDDYEAEYTPEEIIYLAYTKGYNNDDIEDYATGGGVGDEISLAIKYGKMLNDLNKEKQFNKKIELNSALKNFEKQNEISIDSNNVISVKGNKVAYIDKINAKTGQPKTNWDIKKYAKGGKTDFGMLSVKAGIDNNPNPTYADKIAGAKMKKMAEGGNIEIGDKVKAKKEYGGKSGTVIEKRGSFVVVEDSKGKTQSYHESDLVKKYSNGGGVGDIMVGDKVKIKSGYSQHDDKNAEVVRVMPDNKTLELKIKHKVGNEYVKFEKSEVEKYAEGGGVGDYTKSLGMVKVKFADPKYNYETSVSGSLTEKDVRDYFVGKSFNVGSYPKEIFEKVVDIEFFPKGAYAEGGMMDANEENREMVMNNNIQIMHHTHELKEAVKKAKHIPAWVVAKVFEATSALSNVTHYLDGTTKMATGGGIKNQYKGKSYNEIWDNWTSKQRQHFIEDHLMEFMDVANTWSGKDAFLPEIITYKSEDLPYRVYNSFVSHVKSGQYATGGGVGKKIVVETYKGKVEFNNQDIQEMIDDIDMYISSDNLPAWIYKTGKAGHPDFPKNKKNVIEVLEKIKNSNNDVYINVSSKDPYYKHIIQYSKGGSLKGNQHKLDMNKNGRLDAEDFKILRGKK